MKFIRDVDKSVYCLGEYDYLQYEEASKPVKQDDGSTKFEKTFEVYLGPISAFFDIKIDTKKVMTLYEGSEEECKLFLDIFWLDMQCGDFIDISDIYKKIDLQLDKKKESIDEKAEISEAVDFVLAKKKGRKKI